MHVGQRFAHVVGNGPRRASQACERGGRGREREGSGLGLAIVKHVMKAHHGQVRLTSEPGKGSAFTLVLPRDASERPQTATTTHRSVPTAEDANGGSRDWEHG